MLVNGVCDVYNTLQIDSIAVKKKIRVGVFSNKS